MVFNNSGLVAGSGEKLEKIVYVGGEMYHIVGIHCLVTYVGLGDVKFGGGVNLKESNCF